MVESFVESEQTWKKIERDSQKVGYRDGIDDGRNANFQKTFDLGYSEGFKIGYNIGKYKGALMAAAKQNATDAIKDPLLEKISRGWCQVCPTTDVSDLNIPGAIAKQTTVADKYLVDMNLRYKDKVNISLPNKIT